MEAKIKSLLAMVSSFVYIFDGRNQPSTLILQQDAHILRTSGRLRLTETNADDTPFCRSIGRILHAPKVVFERGGAEVDFNTTLKFQISSVDSSPGDGLAFFIAPIDHPISTGSADGNFGIFNPFGVTRYVFAVEFDTGNNPWNPNYKHVGINIESSVSKALMRVDDALIDQEVTASVRYKAEAKQISVEVGTGAEKFELLCVYDLGSVLKSEVQVGIAASTGQRNVAVHDVISWSFYSGWSPGSVMYPVQNADRPMILDD